jgi:hypothetical protein
MLTVDLRHGRAIVHAQMQRRESIAWRIPLQSPSFREALTQIESQRNGRGAFALDVSFELEAVLLREAPLISAARRLIENVGEASRT